MNGDLPEGWTEALLGTLGSWSSGGTPSRAEAHYYGGGIPWVKTAELQDGLILRTEETISPAGLAASSAKVFPCGTLLLAMYGATIGKLGILGIPAATNQACAALIDDGRAPPLIPYVFHYLLSQRDQLKALGQGGAQPNLSLGVIKSYSLPVAPFNEQRRIVAKLEDLLARSRRAKDALDAIPPLLEKLRQSILAAAFRGDLTADWRAKNPDVEPAEELLKRIRIERRKKWEEAELAKLRAKGKAPADDRWKAKYKEPEPVDASELPELPEGWCWASVEELSTKVVDGVHHKPEYVEAGIPFLTVKNLTAGPGISFEITNFVSPAAHAEYFKRADPELGDILISKDGTLGVTRLIRTSRAFSIFVSVALVKPVDRFMGEFLELSFQSPIFQTRFKSTGSGLLHIHLVDLRTAALAIASSAEQTEIVARASTLLARAARVGESQSALVRRLPALSESCLSKAFRGELVEQDPSDEPASAMLERLAAERQAAQEAPAAPKRGPRQKARA